MTAPASLEDLLRASIERNERRLCVVRQVSPRPPAPVMPRLPLRGRFVGVGRIAWRAVRINNVPEER